ncbi:MAG: type II toxin-antitoxin system HicB family antitoxin [bacterium]
MTRFPIRIVLEPQPEGGYTVTSPDVPDLVTEAETVDEAIAFAQEVAGLLYETYRDHGIEMPEALRAGPIADAEVDVKLLPVPRAWAA